MTAALLLARFGVESTVLEAAPRRDPIGSKALCMQRDVLDILERVGVGERLVEEGVTWTLGRTYYQDHELFQITFSDLGKAHFPPFVNIGQDRTEAWLESMIGRSELTEIRYGHEVSGIDEGDRVVGVECSTEAGTHTFESEYVIGADGSHSTVRRLLDIDFPGYSFDDRFLICDIRADLPFENERRFFFDPEWNPGRQVLIHPQAGSVWRIDWQVPPDFDLESERADGGLDRRIRSIVGGAPYEVVWMSVYRFHQRMADRFRDGRVFLAGDAAHLMAPFGARGLNSGIQDVENLAWKLAYAMRGWSPDLILDTYDLERRAAASENLRVTSATMEFLVPHTEEQRSHRLAVLSRAVSDADAAGQVDSGRLAEPYWYTASPLTTPCRSMDKPSGLVPGVLCPDLPLSDPDIPEPRLRRLFGSGVVVLTAAERGAIARALDGVPGPTAVFDLRSMDPMGVLVTATGVDRDLALVVRPDGHVAAVTPTDIESIRSAVLSAIAWNDPTKELP